MRPSGIGGQAVMEGIMMRNGKDYALAVRMPDGTIHVEKDEYNGVIQNRKLLSLPFIRGVFNFIDSLYLGTKTLMKSSLLVGEEEEEGEVVLAVGGDAVVEEQEEEDDDGAEEGGQEGVEELFEARLAENIAVGAEDGV